MSGIFWVLMFAIALTFGWFIRYNWRKWQARQRAEEERFASFMSDTAGAPLPRAPAPSSAPPPAAAPGTTKRDELNLQKLLFDAAHKAGEAGEPALAIQIYARLLARYPETAFAGTARAAVEVQKKKLPKA